MQNPVSSIPESEVPAVSREVQGAITTIILNRPNCRNAVDGPTAQALCQAFREFEADSQSAVAVLWGAGGHFCAGADLKAVASGENAHQISPEGDGPMGPSRLLLSKPVIAAISGYAVAGGLELALWCDLRVVEEDATFGVFCRRWGVPLIDGGTVRLPRLIGLSRALDLILTGRAVGAMEAFEIGLANRLVPKGQARAEAEKLAQEIARFPQVCLRHDRLSTYEQAALPLPEALRQEFQYGWQTLLSGETQNGAMRFVQGLGRHADFEKI